MAVETNGEMPREGNGECVLVTGSSGYIGSHVVKYLLDHTDYSVRGTVRSLSNEEKVAPVRSLASATATERLELVEADLTKPDLWESAVTGCDYVIHVASPFPAPEKTNEDEIVKPAVEGVNHVFQACQAVNKKGEKRVKRVVLTSSSVAVYDMFANGPSPTGDKHYTEEDWADVEKAQNAYSKSKIAAEKTAWEIVEKLEGDEKFELTVINPSLVLGPVLIKAVSTSMQIVKQLLERHMPLVPKFSFACVDVRDVAKAHVKAMTLPDAAGKRHVLNTQSLWVKEMASVLHKEFRPQGYCVPTASCPYFILKVASLFDKNVKQMLPMFNKPFFLDSKRMHDVLGIEPIEVNTSLIDMAYSMIEHGQVKKTKKFKGPSPHNAVMENGEKEAAENGHCENAENKSEEGEGGNDDKKKEEHGGENDKKVEVKVEKKVEEKVDKKVEEKVEKKVEEKVEKKVEEKVDKKVEDTVEEKVEEKVEGKVEVKVEGNVVEEKVEENVETKVENIVEKTVEEIAVNEEKLGEKGSEEINVALENGVADTGANNGE